MPRDVDVRWQQVALPVHNREVAARVYRPDGASGDWLVWAHGGSWSAGSVADWHLACADLARLAGCTVVSVEYRLAPAHPHPAALRDVLAVLDWVSARAGAPSARLAVGGDSAGGTIAACAALVRRDQGRPLDAQVLAYPPLDPACAAASYRARPDLFPHRGHLLAAWRQYLADPVDPIEYSTPFHATDLTGLGPTVLGVGDLDPVLDDVREYRRRLCAADNSVVYHEFPGMPHASFLLNGQNPLREWLASAFRSTLAAPVARDVQQRV
jgi:acetyl esterase